MNKNKEWEKVKLVKRTDVSNLIESVNMFLRGYGVRFNFDSRENLVFFNDGDDLGEPSQAEDDMRKRFLSEFDNVLKTTPYRTQTDTSLSGFIERVLFQATQNINNLDKE